MPLVHRCRFLEYQPEPVNCLVFEEPAREGNVRLALSRYVLLQCPRALRPTPFWRLHAAC